MKFPETKEEFEAYKKALEAKGFTVVSKWRKGLKNIKLGEIVLAEPTEAREKKNG